MCVRIEVRVTVWEYFTFYLKKQLVAVFGKIKLWRGGSSV